MKLNYLKRLGQLFFGLALYAVGIVLTMQANLGYAPWEVFHAGIGLAVGLKIGTISVLAGAVIVAADLWFGEKLGIGTILNMFLIGIFLNMLLTARLIPQADSMGVSLLFLVLGMLTIAFATYFYLGSAFGAGPRDCLMVALARKTQWPIGVCKVIVEWTAVLIGFLLGGMVGVGTVVAAFGGGLCVQLVFSVMRFDATAIAHETMPVTWQNIRQMLKVCPDDV